MMLDTLRVKIKDKKFLRYVSRLLKAGILSNGELRVNEEGTVQGSCTSPALANVVAHYVIDTGGHLAGRNGCPTYERSNTCISLRR